MLLKASKSRLSQDAVEIKWRISTRFPRRVAPVSVRPGSQALVV